MAPSSLIATPGGLISAAFIENVREPGPRQCGVEPPSLTNYLLYGIIGL